MKKFLLSLVGFAAFACVVYIILVAAHGMLLPREVGGNILKYDQASTYTSSRLAEADKVGKVDVLIIGSSHAYRGYDPRKLSAMGYTSMNLGTSAQTLTQTKLLLDRYLDKLKPKYVILDIFPTLLDNNGAESTLELVSIAGYDKELYEMGVETSDLRVYNTMIASYFKHQLHIQKKYNKDRTSPRQKYYSGGFVGYTYKEYVSHCDLNNLSTFKVSTSSVWQHKLTEILKLFKDRKIPYFMFQAPLSKCRYMEILNNEEIDKVLEKFGPYYNFNATRILPDKYFIDDSHLNEKGVDIYNKFVFDKLAKGGIVPR
ncbi:MAG: hypothetical protein EOP47_15215 [Sphingobacteriaceae bacterium]|nr:MAG: hypothetical protein EOP47_15215 [Sphingobacteriaceae bacterium]